MKFLLFVSFAFVAAINVEGLENKGSFKSSSRSPTNTSHESSKKTISHDIHSVDSGHSSGSHLSPSGHLNHGVGVQGSSNIKNPGNGNNKAGKGTVAPAAGHGQDPKAPLGSPTTANGQNNTKVDLQGQVHTAGHGQRTKTPTGNTGTLAKFSSEQVNHHLNNTTRNHNHTDIKRT